MVFDEKYETNVYDYSETFHKTIWGAIVNIAKKGNIQKIDLNESNNMLTFKKFLLLKLKMKLLSFQVL